VLFCLFGFVAVCRSACAIDSWIGDFIMLVCFDWCVSMQVWLLSFQANQLPRVSVPPLLYAAEGLARGNGIN
jgi:hypothetical protein